MTPLFSLLLPLLLRVFRRLVNRWCPLISRYAVQSVLIQCELGLSDTNIIVFVWLRQCRNR